MLLENNWICSILIIRHDGIIYNLHVSVIYIYIYIYVIRYITVNAYTIYIKGVNLKNVVKLNRLYSILLLYASIKIIYLYNSINI